MSPEQLKGQSSRTTGQSDVYSLGAMLFEMVIGQVPFSGTPEQVTHQILTESGRPRLAAAKWSSPELRTICERALAFNLADRYPDAAALAKDLRAFVNGDSLPGYYFVRMRSKFRELIHDWKLWLPLAIACAIVVAFMTSGRIDKTAPNAVFDLVTIDTDPPGAEIAFYPINERDGRILWDEGQVVPGQTPVSWSSPPGDFFVVAKPPSKLHDHMEVFRHVPKDPTAVPESYRHLHWQQGPDGTLILPTIVLPKSDVENGMAYHSGAKSFTVGDPSVGPHVPSFNCEVRPFFMDAKETTVEAIRAINKRERPSVRAMGEIADSSTPIVKCSFDEAMEFAESLGKRLPTEFEYEFAATNSGTTRFPFGDQLPPAHDWKTGPTEMTALWDRSHSTPPVRGLYSNVAEWTLSWGIPYPVGPLADIPFPEDMKQSRIVRGASQSIINQQGDAGDVWLGPRNRMSIPGKESRPMVGFRCVRSAAPQWPSQ